jgi:alpha-L-fucosidase
MNKIVLLFFLSICISAQSQVSPNWESINERGYPQWFNDAKLGIFIHWGVYSVPSYATKEGYAEWFYRGLSSGDTSRINFQKKVYGENFTYADYARLFKAELFKADEWADLFKKSGAKYVLLVSKHHDGYCLWDSKYSPEWNSVFSGPQKDIVGELTDAVRRNNMKMGFYYSLAEWNNPLHRWYSAPHDSIGYYVDKYMIPQFKELVEKYHPSIIFTDGEWYNTAKQWHAEELISWYYNFVGDDAIVNDRWGYGCEHGFRTPEYSSGIMSVDRPWAECRGLGRSFALNRTEPLDNYLTADELIRHFAKLVACGGGMTLNVGPAADGQIPLLQQERLLSLGEWLNINGEAIYNSRTYKKFLEEKEVSIERIDPNIDFKWVRNSPDKKISVDNFTAEWTGFIQPNFSETYTFEAQVDDGIRVWIDEKPIIDLWTENKDGSDSNAQSHADTEKLRGTINLKAGKRYPIKVEYFEKTLNANIQLLWKSTTQAKEVIPTQAFYTSAELNAANGLNAVYRSLMPYLCYTTVDDNLYAIALEWESDNLILNIEQPDFDTKVTMLGRPGDLPWTYNNGQLIIDLSGIKLWEIPCKSAWVFKIYK